MLQHLLYGTAEPRRSRLLNATRLWERENAVPSLERLLQQSAEAEGAPVSESCGMEPLLLQGLCAIRHWTGCRMEKGRERCFVPMIGVFFGSENLGLYEPRRYRQCAGFRGCLFTSVACAKHRNPKGPQGPSQTEQHWWSSSHLTPG